MKKYTSLIFGGSKGIGSEIKKLLMVRGDLVITCSRNVKPSPLDIKSTIDNFDINKLKYKFDNLIFSHRYRGENYQEEYNIMVDSVDKLIKRSTEFLNPNASIVILGSNASNYVFHEQSSTYHYTRGALVSLTKYYAVKLGSFGIRCNLINPGTIIKPENKDFYSSHIIKKQYIEKLTPLKKMGEAKDIANLVDFLCSEKSSFITGQVISVDGGISLHSNESIGKIVYNEID